MEEKVYKTRLYRIILNIFWSIIGSLVIGWLSSAFLDLYIAVLIGAAVFLSSIWLIVWDSFIVIKIVNGHFIVEKRGKIKYDFVIQECTFEAHTKTTSGITGDTECKLYVKEKDGIPTLIDCDLIGITRFNQLLDDLGFHGDGSIKDLKTIKK